MSPFVLGAVALVVGGVATQPIGEALAKPIVGGVVPARIQDLVGYLLASADEHLTIVTPDSSEVKDNDRLRVLGAIGLGSGLAVAALTFVVLRKVLA